MPSRGFDELVSALSQAEAWGAAGPVEIRTTHASVVFLVGDRAYKVKRPVDLGFLDFSTLEKRRRACEAEVRLNRRLAPGVYIGVAPIRAAGGGPPMARGEGELVEWAVEMRRLDDADSLGAHLSRGEVTPAVVADVARLMARFHAEAERGPHVDAYGRHEVVARNALENFDQTAGHVGLTVHPAVHARLRALTREALAALEPVIEGRAARHVPCDTHGDLRVDHVYLLATGPIAIDCIEFDERFRCADPVSDIAFLAMDIGVRGHGRLARALVDAWFDATGDEEGRELLDFYIAYRSAVRAKVAGLSLAVQASGAGTRERARRHWLYALSTLERPERRPALVGVGGLPGTGKSTLSAGLERAAGFDVIRSDVVRHELLGDDTRAAYGEGVYTEAGKDHVYQVCLDRAERLLEQGRRVVVDASFWKDRWRRMLVDRAVALGVPALLITCEADHRRARARLRARSGDASDADEQVHLRAVGEWEEPSPATEPLCRSVDANGAPPQVLAAAVDVLKAAGLAPPRGAVDRARGCRGVR